MITIEQQKQLERIFELCIIITNETGNDADFNFSAAVGFLNISIYHGRRSENNERPNYHHAILDRQDDVNRIESYLERFTKEHGGKGKK